ncbi:MAG: hypothetical protein ACI9UA_003295 [Pseudoalteromonas tetraodonis]|jgi:hypothetical protein
MGEVAPTLVRSIGGLSIKLEGRALTINGRVASEESRQQIQQMLLKRFSGSIDFVRNGLKSIEDELETCHLSIEFTDAIVLSGRIESKATRDQLIRGIEAIAPPGYLVEDRLKIRPAATGSWWIRPTLGACRTYLIRQKSF